MAYVSNSPEETQGASSLSEGIEIFIMPKEVYSAFTSKYSLSEIFEYSKLRKILSREDLARLEILRNKVWEKFMGQIDYWYEGMEIASLINRNRYKLSSQQTDDERREVENSINVMVQSAALGQEVSDRLNVKNGNDDCALECVTTATSVTKPEPEHEPWRIFSDTTALYIIVEEGFLTYLEKRERKLAFLSCLLKAAYAVFPIRMVNSTTWYKQYLEALAA